MDQLLYYIARGLVALIQSMPLIWVARLGRLGGGVAYWVDARHRRVALNNLTLCFGKEYSPERLHATARENFRRIGENFACAVKTASMTNEQLQAHVELVAPERILNPPGDGPLENLVVAIGHFGNFELYARIAQVQSRYQSATTYRGLRQPGLNKLLQSLREQSGCKYFERRFDAAALKAFMNQEGVILGLLADQHAGNNGLRLPFLGHDCSTSAAPAIFALRYNCALYTGFCYRTGLARWRLEAGEEIPTKLDGKTRSVSDIMLDVNRAFEKAVRRDPANWFWVHKRWKPAPVRDHRPRTADTTPAAP